MKIQAGYRIGFNCLQPMPILLKLSVHPERRGDLLTPDEVEITPGAPVDWHIDPFGNRVHRVRAEAGPILFSSTFQIADHGSPDVQTLHAAQVPVETLPEDALPFLLSSRYCEVDLMSDLAWSLFGGCTPGWARVQAIVDYAHDRITFGYRHARSTRTALEGHAERVGVCRDYAHLAVTLCRAMNIPARYCNGPQCIIGPQKYGRRSARQADDPQLAVDAVRIPVIVGTCSTRWWAPIPRDPGRRVRPTRAWGQALV